MPRSARRPVVGISMGDPSGIGPEILAAALGGSGVRAALIPVVFGDPGALDSFPIFRRFLRLSQRLPGPVATPTLGAGGHLPPRDRRPGRPPPAAGMAQLSYVKTPIAAPPAGGADPPLPPPA